jgi:mutual gliding-motility protein MglA
MAYLDPRTNILHCTIVYYGPPISGKTQSFQVLAEHFRAEGRLVESLWSRATSVYRAIGLTVRATTTIHGYETHLHLRTLPGVTHRADARRAMVYDSDGVLFLADSQRNKLQEAIKSMQELARCITRQGRKFSQFPLVLQYNKRDLPGVLAVSILDTYLNPCAWPTFESVARYNPQFAPSWTTGDGVVTAFDAIHDRVVALVGDTPVHSLRQACHRPFVDS